MTDAVVLRQPGAKNQAIMYGSFAAALWALTAALVAGSSSGRWWFAALALPALAVTYAAVRLVTLRVRLDERGIWEPNPFRLTFHTPWSDVKTIRQGSEQGAVGLRFLTVDVVHLDGDYHQVVALNVQAGAGDAPAQVKAWVEEFRAAKKQWG